MLSDGETVMSPQPGAPGSPSPEQHPGTSTVPPDTQRQPQPPQPLSNIYGNTFALHWRFLGSDLDHSLFLSNMFCQIPSEISFIHSSSLTQQAPHLAGDYHQPTAFLCPLFCFPPCPHGPQGPALVWPQPSMSLCGSPEGSAAACPHYNTAGMFTVILFPRKTSFSL